jgi:hypothetical protein
VLDNQFLNTYYRNVAQEGQLIIDISTRNSSTKGKLEMDHDMIPQECEKSAIGVNLSKKVYLRYGDFEFNITA